jgi:chaperonin GroEL
MEQFTDFIQTPSKDTQVFATCNILSQEEKEKRIKNVLETINEVLASTMGPMGKNVIIQDQYLQHYLTKDGYSILSKMAFEGEVENVLFGFIKSVSSILNRKVGDGTTSSTVIATNMYEPMKELVKSFGKVPRSSIIKILNAIKDTICEDVKLRAKPVNLREDRDEKVFNTALLSSNGDKEIAEIINKAYLKIGEYGNVICKTSPTDSSHVKFISGFEHGRGMVVPEFANDETGEKFKAAGNVRVFLTEDRLTSVDIPFMSVVLNHCVNTINAALVIVAPGFDEHFVNFLVTNIKKSNLPVAAVDMAVVSSNAQEVFKDFKTFLGVKATDLKTLSSIANTNCDNVLSGKVAEVSIGYEKSTFIGLKDKDNSEIEKRVEEIQTEIHDLQKFESHVDSTEKIVRLKKRINSISPSGSACIYVGGDTEQEKKSRFYLAEDAIYAVKSALEFGVVPCALVSVPNIVYGYLASNNNDEDLSVSEVFNLDSKYNEIIHSILLVILETYCKSIARIYYNAIDNKSLCFNIAYSMILANKPLSFNELDSEEIFSIFFSDNSVSIEDRVKYIQEFPTKRDNYLINSAQTDIEILKASVSIISLLVNSSSFISAKGFITKIKDEYIDYPGKLGN